MTYGQEELVELGQRLAEDGVHRHEWALQELAFRVQAQSPGAAGVLADRGAPAVLRERAYSVAADVLLRTMTGSGSVPTLARAGRGTHSRKGAMSKRAVAITSRRR
jgi:hypothetical protein